MKNEIKKCKIICAVIPTHNRREALSVILDRLHKQFLEGVKLYVVVVVDGSNDGTLEMLSSNYPDVFVVLGDGHWWYTKSINEGIQYALTLDPDYILAMNDDCTVDSDYIQTIYNDSRSVGSPCLVGSLCLSINQPQIIFFSGVQEIFWPLYRWKYYHPLGTGSDILSERGLYPSVVLPGRGMLIPARVIKSVGYFDESFPQYGSDEDFSLRAAYAGIRSYISYNAIVYSNIESSDKSSVFLRTVGLSSFIKSLFNVYSSNYLGKEIKFVFRHGFWWCFPVVFPKILASRILNFLRRVKL